MKHELSNWAGNYSYRAARLHCPETVEQTQELVARSRRIKALGTRHSFNDIADTSEDLLSLERLDRVMALDPGRRTVTVEAGVRYGDLGRFLEREGWALHNLASLPHISIAGACATATHGSGNNNGNLATAVVALEMVTADGNVVTLSRERDGEFAGVVVGLGALGIVTKVTLRIEPTFAVRQTVYENLPLAQAESHFDAITGSAYSVSLFTDWQNARFSQVWLKRRASDADAAFAPEPTFFEATLATRDLHPIAGISAENCTAQRGVPGPWHERLPHFRLEYTPSSGEELQSEYLVPRPHAASALRAIHDLREHVAPHLLISEVRTVAADDLWLSPCYEQACVGLHFTWKQDWAAVKQVLPRIEERLTPLGARPHWGKLFTLAPAQLPTLFPKLFDFQQRRRDYDPAGKFRNAFLDTYIAQGPR